MSFDLDEAKRWDPRTQARVAARIAELLEAPPRAWYCRRGRTCDGRPHDDYDYPHARADQWPPPGRWYIWLNRGGRGCVAAGTRIWDAGAGTYRAVEEIAEPILVSSLRGDAATDGPPFRKGFADLWTVACEDGTEVTVSAEHRFATRTGWRAADKLSVGHLVAAAPATHPGCLGEAGRSWAPDCVRWVKVASITYSHHGPYYDLIVPGPNSYLAEGLYHHNSGKTRSGAEWTRKNSERYPVGAIVGPTIPHVRDYMVEGISGLQAVFARAGQRIEWEPSKRLITCPNGHQIRAFTAEEPGRLRGPEHYYCWMDEPAHMTTVEEVFANADLGMRLGPDPRIMMTTTPVPSRFIKSLVQRDDVVDTRVSTYANLDNLAPTFRERILARYEGTRLGKQELHGEILEYVEGAMWSYDDIDVVSDVDPQAMDAIVIGLDPSGSTGARSDETGIVAVGRCAGQLYVLADATGKYTPEGWASATWEMFEALGADYVVAERNYGGDMVRSVLRSSWATKNADRPADAMVVTVYSRRGKAIRATPVHAWYERRAMHHLPGLGKLEEELTSWVLGSPSPNRMDAMVHAATYLISGSGEMAVAFPSGQVPQPAYVRTTSGLLVPGRVGR